MRRAAIAEVGGSVVITLITGLYTLGGFGLALYALVGFDPSPRALGVIPLLFGAVNLPLFIGWSREAVRELT